MTDLQVFDMNSQLNFPIPEKSIYQMGFNSAPQPTVPNYVTESSLANPLHFLEMLNPQNTGNEEKKRELITELMAPHYEKQMEIERKLDDLTDILRNFIRVQQNFNEMILEKNVQHSGSPEMEENRMEEQIEETSDHNDPVEQPHRITNPLPIYPILSAHSLDIPSHSASPPIQRNRSVSPEKMETGMSVRDFLKTTMTVQKADEKILEEERQRDRAEENIRFNKFRVRNRPKKYKRSAVTFTSTLEPSSTGISHLETQAPPTSTSSDVQMAMDSQSGGQNNENQVEIEENNFRQIVVPCAQRAPDLALMQPVFPTSSSYVINATTQSHQTLPSTLAVTDSKFQTDPNNTWKAVDRVTHLLTDAPSLLDSDLRSFAEHSHHSSFVPYVGNQEPHHRSAFVPPHYQKERRLYAMDPSNVTDTLRTL